MEETATVAETATAATRAMTVAAKETAAAKAAIAETWEAGPLPVAAVVRLAGMLAPAAATAMAGAKETPMTAIVAA